MKWLAVPLALTAAAALAGPEKKPGPGERAYMQCYSCHATEPAQMQEGPSLHGIIGKRIAAEPGYAYSPALKRFAESNPVWTRELVARFAADPEAMVPGTSMNFHGMRDAAERKALLDYLERLGE